MLKAHRERERSEAQLAKAVEEERKRGRKRCGGGTLCAKFVLELKEGEERRRRKNMKYDSKSNCENLQKGKNKHIWIINKTQSREIKFSTRRNRNLPNLKVCGTRECVCECVSIEMSADC